jgi:hypothetical protein
MPTQIKLPNLGENIESGDVLTIFVSEGDVVKAQGYYARSGAAGRQDHQGTR